MQVRVLSLAVTWSMALASTASAQSYRLQRELRIGAVDGANALTAVGEVVPLADGRLLISQPSERVVRLFGANGEIVRTIGRRGGGPGEFRHVAYIGARADTLWVSDAQSYRVSLFTMHGQLVREFTWPAGRYSPGHYFQNETLTADLIRTRDLGPIPQPAGLWPILRFTPAGAVRDTLAYVDAQSRPLSIGSHRLTNPFRDGALVGFTRNSAMVVIDRRAPTERQGIFSITWISPQRDTVLRRSYRYAAVPVDQKTFDAYVETLTRARMDPAYVAAVRRELKARAFQPPVSAVVVAADGGLWLKREPTASRDVIRWWHIRPDGTLGGEIALPARSHVVAADEGVVWIRERDTLDVEYVTRYRIHRER